MYTTNRRVEGLWSHPTRRLQRCAVFGAAQNGAGLSGLNGTKIRIYLID